MATSIEIDTIYNEAKALCHAFNELRENSNPPDIRRDKIIDKLF